jgi:hypothetical protein
MKVLKQALRLTRPAAILSVVRTESSVLARGSSPSDMFIVGWWSTSSINTNSGQAFFCEVGNLASAQETWRVELGGPWERLSEIRIVMAVVSADFNPSDESINLYDKMFRRLCHLLMEKVPKADMSVEEEPTGISFGR